MEACPQLLDSESLNAPQVGPFLYSTYCGPAPETDPSFRWLVLLEAKDPTLIHRALQMGMTPKTFHAFLDPSVSSSPTTSLVVPV